MQTIKIEEYTKDQTINIAIDTIKQNKQALIFVNSKRSAESVADKITNYIKKKEVLEQNNQLSQEVLSVLNPPTDQCKRLAENTKYRIAFHHSGLHSKQKTLIENWFKNKKIMIIVATPTLAQGVDLPAFRTIIRDLKRYTSRGLRFIPKLEFEQQAGRAGRPGQEEYGEAIIIANDKKIKDTAIKEYIYGENEAIYSKLSVEPVFRMHVLSLIASEFYNTKKTLTNFFLKTFYAHQFKDNEIIEFNINRTLKQLQDFRFITETNETIKATETGKRVSELYIDPITANYIINFLKSKRFDDKELIFMLMNAPEIRPLLNISKKDDLLNFECDMDISDALEFYQDYYEFLKIIKTTNMFYDWINEATEEELLLKYNIRPGELNSKLNIIDWLVHSAVELARLEHKDAVKHLLRLELRLKYGCKDELIPLIKIKNIGKSRARTLFKNNIKNIRNLKKAELELLKRLIGEKTAIKIKNELHQTKEHDKSLEEI